MHPVLRLVKDDGGFAFEDLVRDLHAGEAELLVDLAAYGGAEVVEGGEAVHKAALLTGVFHHGGRDAVGGTRAMLYCPA